MRFEVKQIEKENEESVLVCCYDAQESWVQDVKKAAYGQIFVHGYKNDKLYRLSLSDIITLRQLMVFLFFILKMKFFEQKKNCMNLKV